MWTLFSFVDTFLGSILKSFSLQESREGWRFNPSRPSCSDFQLFYKTLGLIFQLPLLKAFHLCLPPQVRPITTARPPAPLRRLQPPTTTSSPCWMRHNQSRRIWLNLDWDWRTLHQHLITDQGMRVKSGWELETPAAAHLLYILPHPLICYLFVITDTIAQGDSCTFTHC